MTATKQGSPFQSLRAALPNTRRERNVCLLLTANLFILLTSYYLLKTVREALVLGEAGAEIKSYAAAAQPLVLIVAAKAYGYVAARTRPLGLITTALLFFILVTSGLGMLSLAGVPVGVLFFLVLGPFTLIVVAQFWAYAADLLTLEEGKRLFPLINLGGVTGAWVGALAASQLFRFFSAPAILLFAGGGLLLHTAFYRVIAALWRGEAPRAADAQAKAPLSREGVYRLLFSSRYFLLIAGVTLLLNVSKSNGEYLLGFFAALQAKEAVASGVAGGLTEQQLIGVVYGQTFALVNVAGVLIQLLVVPLIFRFVGLQGAVLVLPCVAAMMSTATVIEPVLAVVMLARVLENSLDYSLQNTTTHGLFLPASRDAKYKVQAAVDTRFGDLVSAACVFVFINQLQIGPRQFAAVNTAVIAGWLFLAVLLSREYRRVEASARAQEPAARPRQSSQREGPSLGASAGMSSE